MLLWILQWIVISFVLIFLVHHVYSFLKTTLTIPKTKDLVNRPADIYKEIYATINKTPDSKKELKNYFDSLVKSEKMDYSLEPTYQLPNEQINMSLNQQPINNQMNYDLSYNPSNLSADELSIPNIFLPKYDIPDSGEIKFSDSYKQDTTYIPFT